MFEKKKQEIRSKKQLKKNQTTQPNHNQKAKPPKPAISDAFAFVRRFARCSRPAIIGTAGSRIGSVQRPGPKFHCLPELRISPLSSGVLGPQLLLSVRRQKRDRVRAYLFYCSATCRKQKENKKKTKKKSSLTHNAALLASSPVKALQPRKNSFSGFCG